MTRFNKLMVVALMRVWKRNLHADRARVVHICERGEHITDDDYPIPYRYCPVNRFGMPSFVMNLPKERRGHDII